MTKKEYHTGSRAKIKEYLLSAADRSVSAGDISRYMENNGCPVSITTVYRYLDKLEQDGNLVKYAPDEKGTATYQYVERNHKCDEHLHLKCTGCGAVEHLDCHFMDEISEHIATDHGFLLQCRGSVLYGLCRNCRKQQK